ncbi:EXLDI protein [Streptomyces sp. 135]|uniref:EXLDI protein n=1 Tax=Streptomyces sp. 135 TaxID=2838850 RepID=UPI001CBD32FD|nr:EXLDI protein [Streptomyces sp. 135]
MPNRTIYVGESDVALFQRAQELTGGNLSAAISRALQRFVEIEDAHQAGFEEVEVRVGSEGIYRRKRFVARRIAQGKRPASEGRRGEWIAVYHTRKDRFAVHRKHFDEAPSADHAPWGDPQDPRYTIEYWNNVTEFDSEPGWDPAGSTEMTLDVYEHLDELKAALPGDLAHVVEANARQQPVEDLDI